MKTMQAQQHSWSLYYLRQLLKPKKDGDIAVLDVPNAFLYSDLPEDQRVVMTLTGELAEIMVLIAPNIY